MGSQPLSRRERAEEQLAADRSRRASRLLVAAAMVLPVVTVGLLVLLGLGPAPRPEASAVAATSAAPTPTADLATLPAQAVVDGVLSTPPVGWDPRGAVVPSAADPVADACPDAAVPGVTSASRRFQAGGQVLAVTVTTYAAGAGPTAVASSVSALSSCGDAGAAPSSAAPGVEAYVAWRSAAGEPSATGLVWRRGDVVVGVYVAGRDPSGLARRAQQLDVVLLSALSGRCADVDSTLADAARSPYVAGITFTGRLVEVPVAIQAVPVPEPVSPQPLPSISYPVRPADPVVPSELPTPVPAPTQPALPGPQPSLTVVPSRTADPEGPGCGWRFAGVVAPSFDPGQEAARVEALVVQARDQLATSQQQWQQQVAAYGDQLVAYQRQLVGFVAYAEQVRQVAAAWDTITAGRDQYARDLAAYQAAVAALAQWQADRDAASAAYDAAVAQCDALTVTPTPDPTATDTPAPAPTVVGCPPDVPPILYDVPPTVPPSPTPPAAP